MCGVHNAWTCRSWKKVHNLSLIVVETTKVVIGGCGEKTTWLYVVSATFKYLESLLSLPLKCWDYRDGTPCQASNVIVQVTPNQQSLLSLGVQVMMDNQQLSTICWQNKETCLLINRSALCIKPNLYSTLNSSQPPSGLLQKQGLRL